MIKQVGRYVKDNCDSYYYFNANYGRFLQGQHNVFGII